jgi:peptidoglycan hydrolase-like protein with peptidoglycan-binding domain
MKLFTAGAIVVALSGIGSAPAALAHGRHSSANVEQVRQVQQKLNDLGYHAGSVDGVFGPQTESALRQFQQARNLHATGHIDSSTLAALDREPTGHPTSGVGRQNNPTPVETPDQERRRLMPESEPY